MGVFTVSKQASVGLNLRTPWWLANANIDLDFRNQRYYDSSLALGQRPLAPLSSYLSCTRASIGYAKKSDGSLVSFGNNALRITDIGLLIEDARTQGFDNTDFSHPFGFTNLTTGAPGTAPDGTTTASRWIENTANGTHSFSSFSNLAATAGQTCTASIFIKAAGRTAAYLALQDPSGPNVVTSVDLNTGTLFGSTTGGSNWSNPAYAIEKFINGWWRVSCTGTLISNPGGNPRIDFFLLDASNNSNYTGDGTSGLLVWGPQVEIGAFATTFIPAGSSAVTRAQDQVACSGSLSTILKALPQSVFADVFAISANSGGKFWRFVGDSASFITPLCNNSNDTQVVLTDGTNSLTATLGGSLTFSGGVKVASALAAASGGRSIVGGGGTVATDVVASSALGTPILGNDSAGDCMYGYLRRVAVWNSKLADATLQALTAP